MYVPCTSVPPLIRLYSIPVSVTYIYHYPFYEWSCNQQGQTIYYDIRQVARRTCKLSLLNVVDYCKPIYMHVFDCVISCGHVCIAKSQHWRSFSSAISKGIFHLCSFPVDYLQPIAIVEMNEMSPFTEYLIICLILPEAL